MNEKNHDVLANALGKLSVYSAPKTAWEQIEETLRGPQEDGLQEKIRQLPIYAAPDQVWVRIQGELRGRRRPFYLRGWGIAAVFILLVTLAGIWKMLDQEKVSEVAPMTEKKAPISEMSDIQIADFENQMASEEAELKACIATAKSNAKDTITPDIKADIKQLDELTQTRDSLSFFLTNGKGLPGTSPRLDRLEEKRILLIQKLRGELCEVEK